MNKLSLVWLASVCFILRKIDAVFDMDPCCATEISSLRSRSAWHMISSCLGCRWAPTPPGRHMPLPHFNQEHWTPTTAHRRPPLSRPGLLNTNPDLPIENSDQPLLHAQATCKRGVHDGRPALLGVPASEKGNYPANREQALVADPLPHGH